MEYFWRISLLAYNNRDIRRTSKSSLRLAIFQWTSLLYMWYNSWLVMVKLVMNYIEKRLILEKNKLIKIPSVGQGFETQSKISDMKSKNVRLGSDMNFCYFRCWKAVAMKPFGISYSQIFNVNKIFEKYVKLLPMILISIWCPYCCTWVKKFSRNTPSGIYNVCIF